jgi:hypothetical protein
VHEGPRQNVVILLVGGDPISTLYLRLYQFWGAVYTMFLILAKGINFFQSTSCVAFIVRF